ncbi:MAG: hypothetical protein FJX57_15340 [Alphaproteobacteria bacterium]|nr:hypothetical protein [Alphaproteobacteria bacterium]
MLGHALLPSADALFVFSAAKRGCRSRGSTTSMIANARHYAFGPIGQGPAGHCIDRSIGSLPQGRDWCGDYALTERDDLVVIMEHEAEEETVAGRAGQVSQAGEIGGGDRRGTLDRDADD